MELKECPLWYTATELADWLKLHGYPYKGDLSVFLAKHFQLAFEKGWQKRGVVYERSF